MAHLSACPKCGRTLKKSTFGGSHFPVYTCGKCSQKYCKECGDNACPKCGSTSRGQFDEVYAR